ncbi:MAG: thiamine phosphate synthase [Desulfitobacteriaceae bacterium]|nr:thiamine phosphate synthase [Desulfitobacteriaceae bacterium]MDD4345553.1 thiamine phosphate synthase [Desulfitobacteriaceae bacterium]MDD4401216.1 thiamine phosphate synthase [Desulfitobacteriaceae bacterium]
MIIAVTNRLLCQGNFLERLEQIAQCRPQGIILREKDLSPEEYEHLTAECSNICSRYNVPLATNSYIDVARKLKITHIHLPLDTFIKHKDELGGFQQIGVSVHSVEEAIRAQDLGASYLIAGHIFPTDCKKGVPPRGLEFLQAICATVSIPVFAIGGIMRFNVRNVIKAGAAGVCIMSQLMTCENPVDVIKALRN